MSWRFNSCHVEENAKEASLFCKLSGFNPSKGHTANGNVDNNTLVVTATMDDKTFEQKVNNIDVGGNAVNCKPKKDEVKVIITKPNKDYSLRSKMPK